MAARLGSVGAADRLGHPRRRKGDSVMDPVFVAVLFVLAVAVYVANSARRR
ncbi:MAG: hypothetical protein ACYC1C_14040 [Chloroflexota bacterium]